ncbi:FkbM family methyltransferase [Oricola indica]|jgi:FkbM family methyltransferase|uniref:FkbM family methyltransferase n=1 Tax=Oricola indica TaxID=2872591 RepID=UPI001CBAFDD5|nr:FkbM family methyltransferase [Oricola indica]
MNNFRSTAIFRALRFIKHSVRNFINETSGKRPRIPVEGTSKSLLTLGTEYGGWTFSDEPNLKGGTIVSCGAGEDISFDVLFSAKYGAKVIIVDPTPRAVKHVKEIIALITESARQGTLGSLELYGIKDFSKADPSKLLLLERALWSERCNLKLFPPKNPDHVSHSALDFQNDYSQKGEFIEVKALSYNDLFDEFDIDEVSLLKLDIEGAEVEVLNSLSEKDALPLQICVEYDELLKPNRLAARRVRETHDHLTHLGYSAIYKDALGVNFLYIKNT